MRGRLLALVLCLGSQSVSAQVLESSLRPAPRPTPTLATSGAPAPLPVILAPSVRPKLRPAPGAEVAPVKAVSAAVPRPVPRPRGLGARADDGAKVTQAALIAPPSKTTTRSKKGSVCGDASIKGEVLAPVTARIKGCGIEAPVRVTSVDGVKLSQAAVMDCGTAKALKTWVTKGLQPAFPKTRVVQLQVAAHYMCRPRNNQKGAKISEHGKGRAIDISAIKLADGRSLSVAGDWGKTLRRAYKAACGVFSTTLGPGSDGYHEDHMHFDTARHRGGGSYCR